MPLLFLAEGTKAARHLTSEGRRNAGAITMPKRTVNFKEQLLEDLANPNEAALYLNAAAEESEEMLLVALRDVAEAKQMAQVAEKAGVAREALYRMLSKYGNPTYNSLRGVLNALRSLMCFAPIGTRTTGPRRHIA